MWRSILRNQCLFRVKFTISFQDMIRQRNLAQAPSLLSSSIYAAFIISSLVLFVWTYVVIPLGTLFYLKDFKKSLPEIATSLFLQDAYPITRAVPYVLLGVTVLCKIFVLLGFMAPLANITLPLLLTTMYYKYTCSIPEYYTIFPYWEVVDTILPRGVVPELLLHATIASVLRLALGPPPWGLDRRLARAAATRLPRETVGLEPALNEHDANSAHGWRVPAAAVREWLLTGCFPTLDAEGATYMVRDDRAGVRAWARGAPRRELSEVLQWSCECAAASAESGEEDEEEEEEEVKEAEEQHVAGKAEVQPWGGVRVEEVVDEVPEGKEGRRDEGVTLRSRASVPLKKAAGPGASEEKEDIKEDWPGRGAMWEPRKEGRGKASAEDATSGPLITPPSQRQRRLDAMDDDLAEWIMQPEPDVEDEGILAGAQVDAEGREVVADEDAEDVQAAATGQARDRSTRVLDEVFGSLGLFGAGAPQRSPQELPAASDPASAAEPSGAFAVLAGAVATATTAGSLSAASSRDMLNVNDSSELTTRATLALPSLLECLDGSVMGRYCYHCVDAFLADSTLTPRTLARASGRWLRRAVKKLAGMYGEEKPLGRYLWMVRRASGFEAAAEWLWGGFAAEAHREQHSSRSGIIVDAAVFGRYENPLPTTVTTEHKYSGHRMSGTSALPTLFAGRHAWRAPDWVGGDGGGAVFTDYQ